MRTCPCSDPAVFGHMAVCDQGGYRQNDPAHLADLAEEREAAMEAARAIRMAMTGTASLHRITDA